METGEGRISGESGGRVGRYLQIEVGDLPGVEVVNSVEDLLYELRGLLFTQRLLLGQKVEELAPGHPARVGWGGHSQTPGWEHGLLMGMFMRHMQ